MVAIASSILESIPYSQPSRLGRFDRCARTEYVPPNPIGAKSKRFFKTALRAHETIYEIRIELVVVSLEVASSCVDLQIQSQWIEYNGESFDSRIGQLYLRARWYDFHRFTTLDSYAGDASNPLSFNKYGFVHANPVMGVDPSGMSFLLGAMISISTMNYNQAHSEGPKVAVGAQATIQITKFATQQTIRSAQVISTVEGSTGGALAALIAVPVILGTAIGYYNDIQRKQQERQSGSGGSGGGGGGGSGGGGSGGCNCPPHEASYAPLDNLRRATGVGAAIGPQSLSIDYGSFTMFPGWWTTLDHQSERWERGHLLARSLGGENRLENLVPLTRRANRSQYAVMENELREMTARECVLFFAAPVYLSDDPIPDVLFVYADGDKSGIREWLIYNDNQLGHFDQW